MASGDPVKVAAALARANRVSGGPYYDFGPKPIIRAERQAPRFSPAKFRMAQTCPYRDCQSGCQGTLCHWRKVHVRLDDCYECLGVKELRGHG